MTVVIKYYYLSKIIPKYIYEGPHEVQERLL